MFKCSCDCLGQFDVIFGNLDCVLTFVTGDQYQICLHSNISCLTNVSVHHYIKQQFLVLGVTFFL